MEILCCGARRHISSICSKEATKTRPEVIVRCGMLSKSSNVTIVSGSIFRLETKLM